MEHPRPVQNYPENQYESYQVIRGSFAYIAKYRKRAEMYSEIMLLALTHNSIVLDVHLLQVEIYYFRQMLTT